VLESLFAFLFKYRPVVFENGRFAFGASTSAAVLIVVGLVVASLVAWTYLRTGGKASGPERMLLAGLRLAALAVLAFCLLRPMLVLSSVVPQQNTVAILIDDSKSMRIADQGSGTRADFAVSAFSPESPVVKQLADRFQVRWFRFAGEAGRMNSVQELMWDGTRTRLAPALDRVRDELSHVPVSGLVVVSDGADNAAGALTESLLGLRASQVPVYTVGTGRERFDKDIELSRVSTPRSALKGSNLVVDLVLAQTGYARQSVQVFVEDGGRVVATQQVELSADGEPAPVRVSFPANDAGVRRFRFRVPVQEGERVPENNEQDAVIVVQDEVAKILYFEGEPRHEVAFMRRAIAADKNLQVVLLQRTADAKYLRLAVDSAEELASGFPRTREELFRYRGLVLGSVEASHFTLEQLRMIADFVSERGGGLLMLGGPRAFSEGGWAGTPVADVLPVVLDASLKGDTAYVPDVKVALTRAGNGHVITKLADDAKQNEERWNTLPALSTFNRVTDLKPGATALLTGSGSDVASGQVVMAVQRYGRGQAVALPVNDIWTWQMHFDVPLEDQTHETFWKQLLRFLVSGVPDQVTATLASDRAEPGEPVRITAGVDDERFSRVNDARVVALTTSPSGATTEVPLEWTVETDGEYYGTVTTGEPGLHEVRVRAIFRGDTITSRAAYVDAAESRSEFFGSEMRAPLLRRVADETGGRFYSAANIESLPEDLAITGKGVTVQEEHELWDMPFLLLTILGLVGAEWGVRRKRGMA
jgi:uncharacterized membrane protein